jgi:hemolysin activation/secretion protein
LVNKTEAHLTFGDQFEFYQAASIGGNNGLRGFRHQRFTGKNSFYNSTDLRFNFRKLKSGFAPMNLGFYGGLDLGRVWIDNDNSKQWHNSIGGGVWLSLAEFITGQAGAFSSSDGVRIAFGLGFGI